MPKNLVTADTVMRCGHILLLWFGATGAARHVSTLRLDRGGITFSISGKDLTARYLDGNSQVIDSFPSEQLAHSAYMRIQHALRKYVRTQRIISAWKSVVKWVVLPITAFICILALNAAAVGLVESRPAQTAAQPPLPPQPQPQPTAPEPTALRASPLSPANLAKLLQGGVEAGNFTVQLSSGDKGTLYVFSDPACPHCQRLDKELTRLADDYTIHLFPVTFIGGDDSMHNVARLLCAQPEQRAALWEKAIQNKKLTEEECETGNIAAERNNKIFRGLRFAGVPAIINGDGEPSPDDVPNRAKAIRQWMEGNK